MHRSIRLALLVCLVAAVAGGGVVVFRAATLPSLQLTVDPAPDLDLDLDLDAAVGRMQRAIVEVSPTRW